MREQIFMQGPTFPRRTLLQGGLLSVAIPKLSMANAPEMQFDSAIQILETAVQQGQVESAAIYLRHGRQELLRNFGKSTAADDMFLIASISKPMSVAALMTLYDKKKLELDAAVTRYLPEFQGDQRSRVTVRHLLTHVSGLPDQLPENQSLRQRQAPLSEFVQLACQTPLSFSPGSQYQYSSMAILLAAEIATRISGTPFPNFINQTVFQPLSMQHSALGLDPSQLAKTMRCQVEHAAPESGAGDPSAKDWDWNSSYWRGLGAPWGGVLASARDVGRFLEEFLKSDGQVLAPATKQLMITNQNPAGLTRRGLGFGLGAATSSAACSPDTFGHGGSTGTLAWADPASETILVVLTTLPSQATTSHPRQLVSDSVAEVAAQM